MYPVLVASNSQPKTFDLSSRYYCGLRAHTTHDIPPPPVYLMGAEDTSVETIAKRDPITQAVLHLFGCAYFLH